MPPGLPTESAQEAVHEAAAQHVSSNEQLPEQLLDASGGLSASLGAEQVLLWDAHLSTQYVCVENFLLSQI